MVPSRRALEQDGLIGSQPDDSANAFQKIDILVTQYNPATSHNDRRPVRRLLGELTSEHARTMSRRRSGARPGGE